jgi:hypothetical protein
MLKRWLKAKSANPVIVLVSNLRFNLSDTGLSRQVDEKAIVQNHGAVGFVWNKPCLARQSGHNPESGAFENGGPERLHRAFQELLVVQAGDAKRANDLIENSRVALAHCPKNLSAEFRVEKRSDDIFAMRSLRRDAPAMLLRSLNLSVRGHSLCPSFFFIALRNSGET